MLNKKISSIVEKYLNRNDLFLVKEQYYLNEEIAVSVNVTTYNHKDYIKKCLDGILNQKVDFRVQINIHDDASTDGTIEILNEYKKLYPEIINLIVEKENQYSKDKTIIQKKMVAEFRGKYLATCEGDDFWSDPYKLVLQYHLMENNPDCSVCVHTVKVNDLMRKTVSKYPHFNLKTSKLSSKSFIKRVSSAYSFQTSSYFRRGIDYINFINNKPNFAKIMPNGDEAVMLYSGALGKALYLNREMSVYNRFSENSWSTKFLKTSSDAKKLYLIKFSDALLAFDAYTNRKYHKFIMNRFYKLQFEILGDKNCKAKYCKKIDFIRFRIRTKLSFVFNKIIAKKKYE